MKKVYKIALANVALAPLFTLFSPLFTASYGLEGFVAALGVISIFGGVIDVIVGLLLLAFRRREWAQGYLLAAGILLLSGFALCSGFGMI